MSGFGCCTVLHALGEKSCAVRGTVKLVAIGRHQMVQLSLSSIRLLAAPDCQQALQRHIATERLQWRAQVFRRLVQLLPAQSILEINGGSVELTRELRRISGRENPVAAVALDAPRADAQRPDTAQMGRNAKVLPSCLAGRTFDCIVGTDVLNEENCERLIRQAHELLKPGGRLVFFESRCRPELSAASGGLSRRSVVRDEYGRARLKRLATRAGFQMDIKPFHECKGPISSRLASMFPSFPLLADISPAAEVSAGCFIIYAQRAPWQPAQPSRTTCKHRNLVRSTSCVVPCLNEEMNLVPLVEGLLNHYGEYIHEVILVDDNSFDGTRAVMLHLAESDPRIRTVFRSGPNGVGRALAAGYRKVTGRYVLSLDCDSQQILPEIRDLFDAVAAGADIAVGSRFSRRSLTLGYPFTKLLANRAFHLLARIILMRRFYDLTNNLKLMRREVLESLNLTATGFAVNAQSGLLPLLDGYSVEEVPVSCIDRDEQMSTSSFRLILASAAHLYVLLQLRARSLRGRWRREPTITGNTATLRPAHSDLKIDARA